MSVTGGHLMPGMLEESAMAAIGSEAGSPWSESQIKYSTSASLEDDSSIYAALPEALDTKRKVKIIKVKETTSPQDSADEEEFVTEDDADSSKKYRVIKRQVYTYKDKPAEETSESKYGYKPKFVEEQIAESTQSHVIRVENCTMVGTEAVTPLPEEPQETTTKTIIVPTTITPTTISTTTSTPSSTLSIVTTTTVRKSAKKAKSSNKKSANKQSTSQVTTASSIDSTTVKVDPKVVSNQTLESSATNFKLTIKSGTASTKKSTSKVTKKPMPATTEDPWLTYLDLKEAQEHAAERVRALEQSQISGQSKKKSRLSSGRSRRKSKSSKSRSMDNLNYDWEDEQLSYRGNTKINSVKDFGDGWVSSRRRNRNKSNRRRSLFGRTKNKSKYDYMRMASMGQSVPFNQLLASASNGPIVFPATINKAFLNSPNPLLMASPIQFTHPMLNKQFL